jgi:hypothetical protein
MKRFKPNQTISLKPKIYILCEGDTEINYFKGLIYDKRLTSVEKPYQPEDYSPLGLVNEARKLLKRDRRNKIPSTVWVVFDKDSHARLSDAFDNPNENIKIAFSAICFEYWFLLHFQRTSKSFNCADDLISYLKKYYKNYDKSLNHYADLKLKQDEAIRNAAWICLQNQNDLERGMNIYELCSHTDVHLIVKNLLDLK